MKNMKTVLCVATAALVTGFPAWAENENDEKLQMENLTAEVAEAIEAEAAGGVIAHISSETEDGKKTFEAKITLNGQTREIEVTPDGTLIETSQKITLAEVPDAVRSAFEAKAGGGEIEKVEKITAADHSVTYEAEVEMARDEEIEVTVSADGKIVSEEKNDDEADD